MAGRQPAELTELLNVNTYFDLEESLVHDNLERFRAIFESETEPLNPEDTLFRMPLLFHAAGCGKRDRHYSPRIVEYLVEQQGVDVNRMALRAKAEEYSKFYSRELEFNNENGYFPVEEHVYTTPLMNLVLEGNIEACNYFFNHGADLYQITFDEFDTPVQGETALELAENKLLKLDDQLELGVRENFWLYGGPQYLTKERIKVARGIKWCRYISVDENIPKFHASWQNRAHLRQVLRGAPRTGRLEANYMMSFLPKPAKFQKPSNINLRKINTSLFQGGRTRKRTQSKKRKTRSAK